MEQQSVNLMTTLELMEEVAKLEGEIKLINIQFIDRKLRMDRDEYQAWKSAALAAKMHKQKRLGQATKQIAINKLKDKDKRKPKPFKKQAKDELSKVIDRGLVDEIRLLITPEQYVECLERVKAKIDYDKEIERIKQMKY